MKSFDANNSHCVFPGDDSVLLRSSEVTHLRQRSPSPGVHHRSHSSDSDDLKKLRKARGSHVVIGGSNVDFSLSPMTSLAGGPSKQPFQVSVWKLSSILDLRFLGISYCKAWKHYFDLIHVSVNANKINLSELMESVSVLLDSGIFLFYKFRVRVLLLIIFCCSNLVMMTKLRNFIRGSGLLLLCWTMKDNTWNVSTCWTRSATSNPTVLTRQCFTAVTFFWQGVLQFFRGGWHKVWYFNNL